MANQKKYYVVWNGRIPGIYTSWKECEAQIKGFAGAQFKSFKIKEEAEKAYELGRKQYELSPEQARTGIDGIPNWESLAVDAACNMKTGDMEYQGVLFKAGKRIFHQGPFKDGTNNVGEFLAIVHALAYLKKVDSDLPIYSDSNTAITWVNNKKANTKLKKTGRNNMLFTLMRRAEDWLKNNSYSTRILKWNTKAWGEIPADFGRK